MSIKNVGRLLWRGFYYMRIASSILGFAFTFLTFIQVTYSNLEFLNGWFGGFLQFALASGFFVASGLALFGHWWLKRGRGYKHELDVSVEANVYQSSKLVPTNVPFFEGIVELFEKNNIDTKTVAKLKTLLANSGSEKYSGGQV